MWSVLTKFRLPDQTRSRNPWQLYRCQQKKTVLVEQQKELFYSSKVDNIMCVARMFPSTDYSCFACSNRLSVQPEPEQ